MILDMQDQSTVETFFVFPDFLFAAPEENAPEDTNYIQGTSTGTNSSVGGTIDVTFT